jgi:hypothetical protein
LKRHEENKLFIWFGLEFNNAKMGWDGMINECGKSVEYKLAGEIQIL